MDRTPAYDSVLIYDGECPLCSAAATALRRRRTAGAVSWYDDAAQAFLEAQFSETPFALMFVDRETATVHAGRTAANELCDRAGLPVLVRDIVGENYESIADGVRAVAGLDGTPDPYHGTYPLTDGAAERFDALADAAEGTVYVSGADQK